MTMAAEAPAPRLLPGTQPTVAFRSTFPTPAGLSPDSLMNDPVARALPPISTPKNSDVDVSGEQYESCQGPLFQDSPLTGTGETGHVASTDGAPSVSQAGENEPASSAAATTGAAGAAAVAATVAATGATTGAGASAKEPAALSQAKKKKNPGGFDAVQVAVLTKFYDEVVSSPNDESIKRLAQEVGETEKKVKAWFQSRHRTLLNAKAKEAFLQQKEEGKKRKREATEAEEERRALVDSSDDPALLHEEINQLRAENLKLWAFTARATHVAVARGAVDVAEVLPLPPWFDMSLLDPASPTAKPRKLVKTEGA